MSIAPKTPTEPAGEPDVVALPDRSERYLRLVDKALSGLATDGERRAFLQSQLNGWELRYARFMSSQGQSEPTYLADDPPHCSDFLLTICGLACRLVKYGR